MPLADYGESEPGRVLAFEFGGDEIVEFVGAGGGQRDRGQNQPAGEECAQDRHTGEQDSSLMERWRERPRRSTRAKIEEHQRERQSFELVAERNELLPSEKLHY